MCRVFGSLCAASWGCPVQGVLWCLCWVFRMLLAERCLGASCCRQLHPPRNREPGRGLCPVLCRAGVLGSAWGVTPGLGHPCSPHLPHGHPKLRQFGTAQSPVRGRAPHPLDPAWSSALPDFGSFQGCSASPVTDIQGVIFKFPLAHPGVEMGVQGAGAAGHSQLQLFNTEPPPLRAHPGSRRVPGAAPCVLKCLGCCWWLWPF